MAEVRKYATANAFRQALESRLLAIAEAEDGDIQMIRQQVAFDRLLCRLFQAGRKGWLLKGGYAMQLRVKAARTTRDIDLAMREFSFDTQQSGNPAETVRDLLQQSADIEIGDFFNYIIGAPMMDLAAAPTGGARYPIEARMDGRTFTRFHLDVSSGDVLGHPYEDLEPRDWLGFAGIKRQCFPAISPEEQFAEKLHAYTRPQKDRENSRVKDLVDMVLLIEQGKIVPARLHATIKETFSRRGTHPVPKLLDPPPSFWREPFTDLAEECGIVTNIDVQFDKVAKFVEQLLSK